MVQKSRISSPVEVKVVKPHYLQSFSTIPGGVGCLNHQQYYSPKTNACRLKNSAWKTSLLKRPLCRGHVSFWECNKWYQHPPKMVIDFLWGLASWRTGSIWHPEWTVPRLFKTSCMRKAGNPSKEVTPPKWCWPHPDCLLTAYSSVDEYH